MDCRPGLSSPSSYLAPASRSFFNWNPQALRISQVNNLLPPRFKLHVNLSQPATYWQIFIRQHFGIIVTTLPLIVLLPIYQPPSSSGTLI